MNITKKISSILILLALFFILPRTVQRLEADSSASLNNYTTIGNGSSLTDYRTIGNSSVASDYLPFGNSIRPNDYTTIGSSVYPNDYTLVGGSTGSANSTIGGNTNGYNTIGNNSGTLDQPVYNNPNPSRSPYYDQNGYYCTPPSYGRGY